jgi:hypothetical protein
VQRDGNYFLERNRYHDKLLPKVQKKFEAFLNRQIEGLSNEVKNAHDAKLNKNATQAQHNKKNKSTKINQSKNN